MNVRICLIYVVLAFCVWSAESKRRSMRKKFKNPIADDVNKTRKCGYEVNKRLT